MNTRLKRMIDNNLIPFVGGVWIDCYNQSINTECAGTIISGINSKNHFFVTDMDLIKVLGLTRDEKGKVVDRHEVEVANAVTAAKRENTQNYVVIPANTADGEQRMELGGVCDLSYPNSKTRRGRVQDGGKVTPTLTAHTENSLRQIDENFRIRKLTPRECFRLMGVSDADIDKIQAAGISKSQQYKMAGNSIVVNCLAAIFRQMFIGNFNKAQQTELF